MAETSSDILEAFAPLAPLFGAFTAAFGIFLAVSSSLPTKTLPMPHPFGAVLFAGGLISFGFHVMDPTVATPSNHINTKNPPPISENTKLALQIAVGYIVAFQLGTLSHGEQLLEAAAALKGNATWNGLSAEECRYVAWYYAKFIVLPLLIPLTFVLIKLYWRRILP